MSALPPKADMFSVEIDVCFVPEADKQEGKLSGLVETSHAARHLRLDRRCHISSHFSR